MKVLVLNCGSSSVKFQLIETSPEQIRDHSDRTLARGIVDRIGGPAAVVHYRISDEPEVRTTAHILEHTVAVRRILDALTAPENGLIQDSEEIAGIGHRMVHGGERFARSVLIDERVERGIEDAIDLAPLHNPHNLKGYRAARAALPHARHVAVFDTAFHLTLPPRAYLYGLPRVLYDRHKVRRYGFHGTSHVYVARQWARRSGRELGSAKLITLHLGNGCSACAIKNGNSIDTSMGFTPLEGLVMGTRSGDVDPAAVLHVMAKEELSFHEVNSLLNKHSGLYGLSGISNDMRTLVDRARRGDSRAEGAVDVFCYRARKYIGSYIAALNGADAIVFTGGIGENSSVVRARICRSMDALGVSLDEEANSRAQGVPARISSEEAKVEVWTIPTNEELMIARDTVRAMEAADRD